jgi:DNA invertase Pin-like site-specific DNA recombinase
LKLGSALTCSVNHVETRLTIAHDAGMRIVGYLRVSTDRQAEEGLGLDVQRDAVRKWAKANGHTIAKWCTDEGVSGSNGLDAREGLPEALGALRSGRARGLVVYRLDRLARDLVLQEQLLAEVWRMGARVYSTSASEDAYMDPEGAADDPSRALIRQILGAVSQYERSMIRLRLRSGKARKRAHGGFIGGQVPLGWRTEEGELVADPSEGAVVARAVALAAEGRSLRQVCSVLDAEGLPTKRGGRWHPYTVKLLLDRASETL